MSMDVIGKEVYMTSYLVMKRVKQNKECSMEKKKGSFPSDNPVPRD